MRAAVTTRFGQLPVVTDVPDPQPSEDQVVIRVRSVGLCGSDVKVNRGDIPGLRAPLIQGHEVAGEVMEDIGELRAGQRVAAYIFQACGRCQWCLRGDTTLCSSAARIGFERDGGLADYLCMRPQDLLPFGDDLDFDAAAVSMDAVLSPWRALRVRGQLRAGETLVIVGAGGLGLHACQIGVSTGARVAVIDLARDHLDEAMRFGADLAVTPDQSGQVRDWAGEGADLALEASGSPVGFTLGASLLRAGGTIVCCGYKPGEPYGLDSMRLALNEINVLGSRGGSATDARDALGAVERGEIAPIIAASGSLSDVPMFLDRLAAGDVVGRLMVRVSE